MLTLRPLTNAQQAAVYFERDDYYVDGRQVAPSSWWGEGARRLRLFGPVDREAFAELLEGRLPDGTVLEGGYTGQHRPGVDLTFSAPKSVSLAALVGGDERILKAHEAAVTAALRYLQETTPRARNAIGGTTRLEQTQNLIVARFNHDTSRALDPQLHTHAVVLNVARRSDGAWRALANEELFRSKMIGGAIYRSVLARRLGVLGYETVRTHADGRFEIAGVTKEQLAAFSRRRVQILEHLEQRGLHGHRAGDAAARATRDAKRDIDRGVLRAEWTNQARKIGIEPDRLKGRVIRRPAGETRNRADECLDRAVDRLTERNVVVSEKRLIETALNLGVGKLKLEDVRRALDRKLEHEELVPAVSVRQRDPFIRHFTTDRALAAEQELLRLVERGRGQVTALATDRDVDRLLNTINLGGAHELTRGQEKAIELALSTSDRVVGIQGYAGTGKTSGALLHIQRFAEEQGLEVRGFAPTAAAAEVLSRDAGIEAMTIARFLRSARKPQKQPKQAQLWVIDEASMMSNETARALLAHAERAGARVVLAGDRDQLPSIEAGRAFGLLQDRGMPVARVDSIVRQKDPELKRAVQHTIARDHDRALGEVTPRVAEIEERSDRLLALAKHYVGLSEEERDGTLVVTPSNHDRRTLNTLIREGLHGKGELGMELDASVLMARDLTTAERKDPLQYREGDVVRFGRRYRSLDVAAGDYLTVRRVDPIAGTVELRDHAGRARSWRPDRASKVEVYEASNRDLAAGDRIRFTRNERRLGRYNGQIGRVVTIDLVQRTADVLAGGRLHTLHLDRHRHWEHAYASTVHAAQGRTADRVLMHLDTKEGHLVGHELWYVAISRARKDVRIYTDDGKNLPPVIRRSLQQEAALEVVRAPEPKRRPKQKRDRKHKQERHHGYGYGFEFGR